MHEDSVNLVHQLLKNQSDLARGSPDGQLGRDFRRLCSDMASAERRNCETTVSAHSPESPEKQHSTPSHDFGFLTSTALVLQVFPRS